VTAIIGFEREKLDHNKVRVPLPRFAAKKIHSKENIAGIDASCVIIAAKNSSPCCVAKRQCSCTDLLKSQMAFACRSLEVLTKASSALDSLSPEDDLHVWLTRFFA